MRPYRTLHGIVVLCILSVALYMLVFMLPRHDPIPVGFSGQLEGKFADLGIQGRNGAQLAMEHINAAGGVCGRQLQLITRHDGTTKEEVTAADTFLVRQGVVGIIGHMVSHNSVLAVESMRSEDIIFISPTTSTPELSGKKDAFFRVIPDNTVWAKTLADYAVRTAGAQTLVAVYDADNQSYTLSFTKAFIEQATHNGASVPATIAIHGSGTPDWHAVIDDVHSTEADSLMLALSSRDTVNLAQQLHRSGLSMRLFSSPWALTSALILTGGRHIEGLTSSVSFNPENTRPEYQLFHKQYRDRFGQEPSFAAAFGYEAMQLLAAALQQTNGKKEGLRAILPQMGPQNGVIGSFSLDEYGDCMRAPFILTVRNGTMVLAQ